MLKKYFLKIFSVFIFLSTLIILWPKKLFPGDNLVGLYHPFRDLFLNIYPAGYPFKNALITDPFLQIFPWKYLTVEAIKNFSLPLWNPYSFSGYPLLANFQSGVFFPLNIMLLSSGLDSWHLFIFIQIPITFFSMFLFLRKLSVSKISAIFSSVCYALSGFSIGWLEWGNIVFIFAFLPLALYFVLCLEQSFSRKNIFLFYASLILIPISGHLQFTFYSYLVIVFFVIVIFFNSRLISRVPQLLIILILSILTVSIQIFPTLELIKNSYRSVDISYFGQEDWFIPLKHFISLISPDFFGSPARQNYWGVWNHLEFNLSFSVAALFFSLLGIKKRKINIFFLILLIIALVFSTNNLLSQIIYANQIPFISSAQPSRLIFIVVFALCCLAAFGVDEMYKLKITKFKLITVFVILTSVFGLLIYLTYVNFNIFLPEDFLKNQITAKRNLIFPLFVFLLVLMFIFLSRLKLIPLKLCLICLTIISLAELTFYANKFLPYSTKALFYPTTKITEFINHDNSVFRVSTNDDRIFPPNISAVYGIQSPEGYDPLYPKTYAEFIGLIESSNLEQVKFNRIVRPKNINSNLYPLINAKYILSFDKELNNTKPIFSEGITNVFINQKYLERAYLVQDIINANSDIESKQFLLDKDFDPKSQAVVIDVNSNNVLQTTNSESIVNITSYKSNIIKIKTKTTGNSFLVLLDNYFPGWKAKVNNVDTKIYRTNHTFRGIYVPSGENEIIFEYKPNSFRIGALVSLTSIILMSLFIFKIKKNE